MNEIPNEVPLDQTTAPVDYEGHDPPEPKLDTDPEQNGTDEGLLSELRNQRRQIGEDRHIDIGIPGYENTRAPLVVRYRRMEWEEVKRLAEAVSASKNPRKELLTQCDYIAAACEEILLRKDGKLEPLYQGYPWLGDEPICYDDRLAQFLGFDAKGSHRTAVLGAFNNEFAVVAHHNELAEWMQSSRQEEEEAFTPDS